MLAYAELLAFDRMAADARYAPDLRLRATMGEMAATEIANYRRLADRLTELGVDPESAMEPFVGPLRAYHDQTEPSDWYEGLTKAYVGDAVADDFTREAARSLDSPDRELILEILHDSRHVDFAAAELKTAIEQDPKRANRLSMWARRLVGEGLSQAVRIAQERPALVVLLIAADAQDSAARDRCGAVPGLFKRLTTAHGARMAAVGLNN